MRTNFFDYFLDSSDRDPSFIRIVKNILIVALVANIAIIILVSGLIPGTETNSLAVPVLVGTIILEIVALIFASQGKLGMAKFVVPPSLIIAVTIIAINANGIHDISVLGYPAILVVGTLLLGKKSSYTSSIFSLIGIATVALADITGVTKSEMALKTDVTDVIISGILLVLTSQTLQLLISRLNENILKAQENENAQREANKELLVLQEALENRVAERTSQLELANRYSERRAKQFEAISQVSRVINRTQNLQDLMPEITQVISQYFGFYHTGIFLLDLNKEYAILSAANSDGGQKMLVRDHKLKVGQGIVGYTAGTGRPRIALDTGQDSIYFNNPDLPETRSEMALPLLRAGTELIGVLDIQSVEPNAFGQEDIEVLSTLAEQVSVAIVNARLYETTQKAITETELLYRQDLQSGWGRFARSQNISGIRRSGMKASLLAEPLELTGVSEAIKTGSTYIKKSSASDQTSEITVPVKLRGEVVGTLNIKSAQEREWGNDQMDIISAIVERTALAIESARLLQDAQKRAIKERTIGEISAKIGSLVNLENILQTTIQELGNTLPGTEIAIQLTPDTSEPNEDLR